MAPGNQISKRREKTVARRSQQMAIALSSYARALTFENRSRRNLYRLAGLSPRLRDQIFERLLLLSFIVCFAIPMVTSTIYYLFIVSPQYSTEVRFVVRSSAPLLSRDRYASSNAEPKAKIVQDTSVILNYLESPTIIGEIDKQISIDRLYGDRKIDFFSRLPANATHEEIEKYWKSKISANVNPKSGIVTLDVYAFSPQDSFDLLGVVLKLAEQRVNRLNSGIWSNLMESARSDVEKSTEQLENLRAKFRDAQNATGVFDIELASESRHEVLTKIEANLAMLKSERDALSGSVGKDSPRLTYLDRQIAAASTQIGLMKERIAGGGAAAGRSLADTSELFDTLKMDVKLAEERLASAIAELEKVKLISSLQLVYLDRFTEPVLSDKSSYPNPALSLFLTLLGSLAAWGVCAGSIVLIRNKID